MATTPAPTRSRLARPRPALHHGSMVGPRAYALASASTVAAGLLLVGCGAGPQPPATALPTVWPAGADQVVRGHDQAVTGALTGGGRVRGTLYPALPGANTLRLRVDGAGDPGAPERVEVAATMLGMAMRPVTTTLVACDGRYQGTIALPMFGRYAARVVVVTRRGRWRGTLTLDVPLALGT